MSYLNEVLDRQATVVEQSKHNHARLVPFWPERNCFVRNLAEQSGVLPWKAAHLISILLKTNDEADARRVLTNIRKNTNWFNGNPKRNGKRV